VVDATGRQAPIRFSPRLLGDYLSDECYRELQRALMENPELGEVMPGTGGFRKARWTGACACLPAP
jgi:hypothetical protein